MKLLAPVRPSIHHIKTGERWDSNPLIRVLFYLSSVPHHGSTHQPIFSSQKDDTSGRIRTYSTILLRIFRSNIVVLLVSSNQRSKDGRSFTYRCPLNYWGGRSLTVICKALTNAKKVWLEVIAPSRRHPGISDWCSLKLSRPFLTN